MGAAQVATRLTCFALISAIERDIRRECRDLAALRQRVDILPSDVRQRAAARWARDREERGERSAGDIELLDYTDFADLAKVLNSLNAQFSLLKRFDVSRLASRLETLSSVRNRVCHSRPLEADDFTSLHDFAAELASSAGALFWSEVDTTLDAVRDNPRSVLKLVIPEFWTVDAPTVQHNLPLPEFDDTGFIGRHEDRKNVSRYLNSPHPIVTIVGEGGAGKTALALRCLYDLLEQGNSQPYDALVWISLKTQQLTPQGVREIQTAVASTLGVVKAAAFEIGVLNVEDLGLDGLISELKLYMSNLRILLTIDNLETLSWETLRPLLSEIPLHSKVLVTSRIGLGELEVRYPLSQLDSAAAVTLARKYARTFNLDDIFKAKEVTLRTYCKQLYHNPLLIKWFVSSVAAGANAMALLDKRNMPFQAAIEFCFENLFTRLSSTETEICHILASARRPLSQPELYYLTDHLDPDSVDMALSKLHQSSILTRSFAGPSDLSTNQYALSQIAVEYLSRKAPPPNSLFQRVHEKLKMLRGIVEQESVQRAAYKYDPMTIHASTGDEKIAAVYLRRALNASQTRDWPQSEHLIAEAKRLMPGYSEVHRIAGAIEARHQNPYRASDEYESAIACDPKSAIANYTYAQFLIRELGDYDKALGHLDAALSIDPTDPSLKTAKARALTRLGRFEEASRLYEELLDGLSNRPLQWRRSTRDQAAECYRRWAVQDWRMKDENSAWGHVTHAVGILQKAFDTEEADFRLLETFAEVVDEAMRFAAAAADEGRARDIVRWIGRAKGEFTRRALELAFLIRFKSTFAKNLDIATALIGLPIVPSKNAEPPDQPRAEGGLKEDQRRYGWVKARAEDADYGFIRDSSGDEWFFHRSFLPAPHDWHEIAVGRRISFRIGYNREGPCAIDVRVEAAE